MTVFHKMHGLGNHFVIVDRREQVVDLPPFLALADPCTGIGYDQLVILAPSVTADLDMEMYNADGSRLRMCGNAARCVAWLEKQRTGKAEITMSVFERVVRADKITDHGVRVDMGNPILKGTAALHPALPDAELISVGSDHAVFFVPSLDAVDTTNLGPLLERHPLFPDRSNIEFCEVIDDHIVRVIVWERGTGFTQACGSGACAVGVAAIGQKRVSSPVITRFPGGDLKIEWQEGGPVLMTGPISYVFEGRL